MDCTTRVGMEQVILDAVVCHISGRFRVTDVEIIGCSYGEVIGCRYG